MGALHERAGYVGAVDVGMAVTGIEGAAPYGRHQWGDTKFTGPPPRRTARVAAAELRDDANAVTLALIASSVRRDERDCLQPFRGSAGPLTSNLDSSGLGLRRRWERAWFPYPFPIRACWAVCNDNSNEKDPVSGVFRGGRTWDRTRDLPRVKRALSR
jgi:hypothetical protein